MAKPKSTPAAHDPQGTSGPSAKINHSGDKAFSKGKPRKDQPSKKPGKKVPPKGYVVK